MPEENNKIMTNPNPLYSFTASYRTPSGRLTYANGVVRQLTGEDNLAEAIIRTLKSSGRRQVASDLQASFFEV